MGAVVLRTVVPCVETGPRDRVVRQVATVEILLHTAAQDARVDLAAQVGVHLPLRVLQLEQ